MNIHQNLSNIDKHPSKVIQNRLKSTTIHQHPSNFINTHRDSPKSVEVQHNPSESINSIVNLVAAILNLVASILNRTMPVLPSYVTVYNRVDELSLRPPSGAKPAKAIRFVVVALPSSNR